MLINDSWRRSWVPIQLHEPNIVIISQYPTIMSLAGIFEDELATLGHKRQIGGSGIWGWDWIIILPKVNYSGHRCFRANEEHSRLQKPYYRLSDFEAKGIWCPLSIPVKIHMIVLILKNFILDVHTKRVIENHCECNELKGHTSCWNHSRKLYKHVTSGFPGGLGFGFSLQRRGVEEGVTGMMRTDLRER